ncbi:MAG TPA: AsnC family transcriptional regulator [archaeon]|nr:AsnC family transcriptional regulator [archaeon]
MTRLDSLDQRILGAIQSDFPVCERPFKKIAEKLGISEETLIRRVAALKERKIIRRFGPVFDSRKLGYASTLVALRIPDPDRIESVAAEINAFSEVTHNYEREDCYNLWFTVIASTRARILEITDKVASLEGVAEVIDLPAEEVYKIRAQFEPTGEEIEGGA